MGSLATFLSRLVIFATTVECLTLRTNSGLIRGFQEIVNGIKVDKFLGIPFAKPPIGELRFAKPQPPETWTSVKQTNAYGPSCMQRPNDFGFPIPKTVSEDCLTLNVFAPHSNGTKAVMVFVHGGGYFFGGSFQYDYTEFAARGDIIIVTFNYRLDAFGFMNIDGSSAPSNIGLWDQIAALKWVQDNIQVFKGDPNRVTIFGESAGGASVSQLALTAAANRLFHRIIPQSGSSWCFWAWSAKGTSMFSRKIGDILGCNAGATERAKLLDCLRNADADRLLNASFAATEGMEGLLHYVPEIDGDMFTHPVPDIFSNPNSDLVKHFRSLDYMGGFNDGDGALLLPKEIFGGLSSSDLRDTWIPDAAKQVEPKRKAEVMGLLQKTYYDSQANKEVTGNSYVDLLTDWNFSGAAGIETEKHVSPAGGATYLYYLTKVPSFGYIKPLPSWFRRANHADELSFLIGPTNPTLDPNFRFDDDDTVFSKKIMTYWANFAKTGNPNRPDQVPTTWLQYTSSRKEYINLGDEIKSGTDVIPGRMELWAKIIPEIQATTVTATACGLSANYNIITLVMVSIVANCLKHI